MKKLLNFLITYIIPLLSLPTLLSGLYKCSTTSEFWEYESSRSILAPVLRIEKEILSMSLYLTCIFLLPLIGVLIRQIIKLKKSNKKLTDRCNFLSQPPEFKLKFGVLWDKNGNPYCGSCKILIGETTRDTASILVCPKCKSNFRLREAGKDFFLEDAVKML